MQPQALLVGIDPGEQSLAVCVLHPPTAHRKQWTLNIECAERQQLPQAILRTAQRVGAREVRVCIEATTSNAALVHRALHRTAWPPSLHVQVRLVPPTTIRYLARARLLPTKTDTVDARVIAHAAAYPELPQVVPEDSELRTFISEYIALTRQWTALRQRCRALLLRINPALVRHFDDLHRSPLLAVVVHCLDYLRKHKDLPRKVLDDHLQRLAPRYRKQADQLYRLLVDETVHERLAAVDVLQRHLHLLALLRQQRQQVKQTICRHAAQNEIVRLLTTIPGIGRFTAAVFVALVGDIRRFRNRDAFVGYIGTYPVRHESGRTRRKSHMCKKGQPFLKCLLYTAAMAAVGHCPRARAIYERARARGLSKKAAFGVVMTHLARWIYGVWKSRQPFHVQVQTKAEAQAPSHPQATTLHPVPGPRAGQVQSTTPAHPTQPHHARPVDPDLPSPDASKTESRAMHPT